jgi:glycerol-3-phosphate acyltransferase PlsY
MDQTDAMIFLGTLLLGYAFGSVPYGLLLVRAAGLGDVRKFGSGSTGATNVLRAGNKTIAALTLLLDALKGAAAVWIGAYVDGAFGMAFAGLGAVLGHLFPVWLDFKGGKGIATGAGVLLAAMPLIGLIGGVIWLASAIITRISSLSSLLACAAMPVLAIALQRPFPLQGMTLLIAILIFERHRANIARLIAGTEPRIGR